MSVAATPADIPKSRITVGLIGNPNTGKTELFNALTGLHHRVANYPGVTVERKEGSARLPTRRATIVDLPGTYSLAARSPDELLVVDLLLNPSSSRDVFDVVVVVLDAANLERNLYLFSQLMELGKPLVAALNRIDVAARRGVRVDAAGLERRLGVPVVETRADRGQGVALLRAVIDRVASSGRRICRSYPSYSEALDTAVSRLHAFLREKEDRLGRPVHRAEALRALVDKGGSAETRLSKALGGEFERLLASIRSTFGPQESPASLETAARYRFSAKVLEGCFTRPKQAVVTVSDRIDAVVTHKVWGTLILVGTLGLVFQSIYSLAVPFMSGIEGLFTAASALAQRVLPPGLPRSFLSDAVIGGVGSVVIFLPQILLLFFFVAVLESCGYLARAAFLMDRLFGKFGLSGKSAIPLISSFACAVPGIMATRTIESPRERLMTMMVAPLMSCSARLPVYVLFIGAFVPDKSFLFIHLKGLTLLGMHLLGVAVSVPVVFTLRRLFAKSGEAPFILELPSYTWPSVRSVVFRLWMSGRSFLVRAGTIVFATTVVVWALSVFPRDSEVLSHYSSLRAKAASPEELRKLDDGEAGDLLAASWFGRMGRAMEPAVRPLGWDWRIGMATLASFPAREVIISTMGTVYNLGRGADEDPGRLKRALSEIRRPDGSRLFTLATALSIMVFFALCCQCGATLATIRRETNSFRWPVFTFLYMTVLAYVAALVTYKVARLTGL